MTTLSQVIDYIPRESLDKLAYLSIQIWLVSPVLVMIGNLFFRGQDDAQQSYRLAMMVVLWYIFLTISGVLGLLTGLLMSAKSRGSVLQRKNRFTWIINNHLVPSLLILFLFWSLLSALLSPNPDIALGGTFYRQDGWQSYLLYAGIFCSGYCLRSQLKIRWVIITICVSASLLALFSILHMSWMKLLLGLEPESSVFHNSNHYAYYLCIAIFCSYTGLLQTKKAAPSALLFWSSFTINTAALVLNQSFGPYLAVMVGLSVALILALLYEKANIRKTITVVIVFALLSLVLNLDSMHILQDIRLTLNGMRQITTGDALAGHAGSGRWGLWVAAFKFMLERPVFGFGPDNLGPSYLKLGIGADRPHNEILQFAASLGIPAALLYATAVLVHLRDWFLQRKQATALSIGLVCLLLAYWFSSLFGNTMYYTTPFFVLFWGLSAGQLRRSVQKK